MTVKTLTTGWPDQSSITLEELFDVCNDSIGYISLTDHSKEDETDQEPEYLNFIARVRPYFISEFKTKTWYAFHLGNPSFPDKLTVRIYRFAPELRDILVHLKDVRNIYFNDAANNLVQTFPMDICFFRKDGSILFGSVSHERLAGLYIDDTEENPIILPERFLEFFQERENNIPTFINKLPEHVFAEVDERGHEDEGKVSI